MFKAYNTLKKRFAKDDVKATMFSHVKLMHRGVRGFKQFISQSKEVSRFFEDVEYVAKL